jgi:hypothetical protein
MMQPNPEIHRLLARERERDFLAAAERRRARKAAVRPRVGLRARFMRLGFRRKGEQPSSPRVATDAS